MERIADLIRRSLNSRVFVPLLILALMATWYGLGPSQARFAALTGGQRFVDVQPALTAASLVEQAHGYGPDAVRYYFWWSAFDFAWPLLTFTAMLFMAAWLFGLLPERRQRLFTALVTVGYATVLMDWGENLGFVGVVLTRGPQALIVAKLAIALHTAKLAFLAVFNVGCLAVLLWALARRVRSRASA